MLSYFSRAKLVALLGAVAVVALIHDSATAQLVPGRGRKVTSLGDDFEDANWKYNLNWPKGSHNLDKDSRYPEGASENERWYEGPKRGTPEMVRRIETPAGGIEGSSGSLLLRSCFSGVPGRPSHTMQQDDLICNFANGPISFSRAPSFVVRIYMQDFDQWEKRSGPAFALRSSVEPPYRPQSRGLFSSKPKEPLTYWPGIMVDFYSKTKSKTDVDKAYFRIRANESGGDYEIKEIKETGWWTLGMSFTPDGQVHYFARHGVEDLRPEDHLASHHPYGERGMELNTVFFCTLSQDDGKTWSTPLILDDPSIYVAR